MSVSVLGQQPSVCWTKIALRYEKNWLQMQLIGGGQNEIRSRVEHCASVSKLFRIRNEIIFVRVLGSHNPGYRLVIVNCTSLCVRWFGVFENCFYEPEVVVMSLSPAHLQTYIFTKITETLQWFYLMTKIGERPQPPTEKKKTNSIIICVAFRLGFSIHSVSR